MSDEKPDWKEWKRALSDKKSKVTKAPPPISPLRGGSGSTFSPWLTTAKKPDWKEWNHIPTLWVWQACALSLDIDPHSMKSHPQSWMTDSGARIYASESFPSEEAKTQFELRERVLLANLVPKKQGGHFSWFVIDYEDPYMNIIRLPEFAAWCVQYEFDIPPELAALAKDAPRVAEGEAIPQVMTRATPERSVLDTHSLNVFRSMKLAANEVSIAFVGDKPESGIGANNRLEIFARGVKDRVPLSVLDLVDGRTGNLNSQCAILLGMARKIKQTRTDNKFAAQMTRLRAVFRTHLGITKPFADYRVGAGWEPLFNIEDKRGALDERAMLEAERRTVSYEGMLESGERDGNVNQAYQPPDSENDAADDWLKENDPNAPA